jgi:predicted DNA-binding ribbon-helix-helix protein
MTKITKRSVTIAGHSTSITLEDEFWVELNKISVARGISLASLIHEIDKTRRGNLSSTLRVYILNHLKDLLPK